MKYWPICCVLWCLAACSDDIFQKTTTVNSYTPVALQSSADAADPRVARDRASMMWVDTPESLVIRNQFDNAIDIEEPTQGRVNAFECDFDLSSR
ncbi:MAG: hypothetical protein QNK37_24700 [Acidobacteriota bacterium]|nr:hypothetical protein [Acidobacteriota bacterium]